MTVWDCKSMCRVISSEAWFPLSIFHGRIAPLFDLAPALNETIRLLLPPSVAPYDLPCSAVISRPMWHGIHYQFVDELVTTLGWWLLCALVGNYTREFTKVESEPTPDENEQASIRLCDNKLLFNSLRIL